MTEKKKKSALPFPRVDHPLETWNPRIMDSWIFPEWLSGPSCVLGSEKAKHFLKQQCPYKRTMAKNSPIYFQLKIVL